MATKKHGHGAPDDYVGNIDDGYERTDARISGVLATGFFLFAAATLTAFAMYFYYKYGFEEGQLKAEGTSALSIHGDPHENPGFEGEKNLQISPRVDMNDYRHYTDQYLTSYGWVQKPVGVVRIPIDEAIKVTLQRGLPTRKAELAAGFVDQGTSAAQDSSSGRTYRNRLR